MNRQVTVRHYIIDAHAALQETLFLSFNSLQLQGNANHLR